MRVEDAAGNLVVFDLTQSLGKFLQEKGTMKETIGKEITLKVEQSVHRGYAIGTPFTCTHKKRHQRKKNKALPRRSVCGCSTKHGQ